MGACQSCVENEREVYHQQILRSEAIDRGLQDDARRMRRESKILLLGSENSGKSTIVKQMKIIHQNGYTVEELAAFRLTIYKNVVDSAKAVVGALRQLEIDVEDPANVRNCDLILDHFVDPDPTLSLGEILGNAITALWNDPCMSKLFDRSSEFHLMDSAPYFFDEVQRIASPDYIPTESDVLRARTRTTGISETRFVSGETYIHMFDVGGQRSERKKWIHCFQNVTAILYCVALSEYDLVLLEDEGSQNRLMESLVLFDSIVNSRWFTRTSIILFLNKIDLFKAKLGRSPLANYFPDYDGGNDLNRAAKYILWRFQQLNRAYLNLYAQYV